MCRENHQTPHTQPTKHSRHWMGIWYLDLTETVLPFVNGDHWLIPDPCCASLRGVAGIYKYIKIHVIKKDKKMKTFLQFINEDLDINSKLSGDTHSIIDGLNRSKNAIMNNNNQIHAKIIDQNNLKPLSKKEDVVELADGRLKVFVKEKPVDGRANEAVRGALARYIKVSKSRIQFLHGLKSRLKRVEILG